jgi:hypothetical protein
MLLAGGAALIVYRLVATLVSLVTSGVLGVRLLRLARRTGELPELVIGASFLVAGVLGFLATSFAVGPDANRMSPTHIALISTLTLTAAIAQWLAFFPPRAYLHWIRGQAVTVA